MAGDHTSNVPHLETRLLEGAINWSEPVIVHDDHLRLDIRCSAFGYATYGRDGIVKLFRPEVHHRRLIDSAVKASIPPVPFDHLWRCIKLVFEARDLEVSSFDKSTSILVQILILGCGAQSLALPSKEYLITIGIHLITLPPERQVCKALAVEFPFPSMKSRNKCAFRSTGVQALMLRYPEEAHSRGCDMTLLVDPDNETGVTGLFESLIGVKYSGKDSTLYSSYTDAESASIEADCCFMLAEILGWRTEHRKIRWDEMAQFDEIFVVSAHAPIIALASIYRQSSKELIEYASASNTANSVSRTLNVLLSEIQRGDSADVFSWWEQI